LELDYDGGMFYHRYHQEPVGVARKFQYHGPNFMTLIVGVVCQNEIVVASESQYTFGQQKDLTANKIHQLNFAGVPVLIAESGHAEGSHEAIDLITQASIGASVEKPDSISQVVEECVQQVLAKPFCGAEELEPPIN
jgi:hypothetical protein